MAERREYGIPGDPELAIHLGYTKELDWTPQRLNKELRLLEEVVESWGELPDKWRHKNRKEWAWMKDTALMVYNCRAAFRARRSKKAIKIYKLIQGRLATKDKQPLQKQRAAARKGDQQTSEKAQAKRAEVVNLLEDDTKRSPEQIGRMVGLSGPRVRGIKRERRRASKSPMAKQPKLVIKTSGKALKKSERWEGVSDPETKKLAKQLAENLDRHIDHRIATGIEDEQDRKEVMERLGKQAEAELDRSEGGKARAETYESRNDRIVQLRKKEKTFGQIAQELGLKISTVKMAYYRSSYYRSQKNGDSAPL